jgi:PAS domain-containing protein
MEQELKTAHAELSAAHDQVSSLKNELKLKLGGPHSDSGQLQWGWSHPCLATDSTQAIMYGEGGGDGSLLTHSASGCGSGNGMEEWTEAYNLVCAESDQRQSQIAELVAEKAAMMDLLNSLGAAVIALGEDGCVSEWNRGAEQLVGLTKEQARPRKHTRPLCATLSCHT